MNFLDIIQKKKENKALSEEEIKQRQERKITRIKILNL